MSLTDDVRLACTVVWEPPGLHNESVCAVLLQFDNRPVLRHPVRRGDEVRGGV